VAVVTLDDEILTPESVTPFKFGVDGGLRQEAPIRTTRQFHELIDAALAQDADHVVKEPSWG